MYAQRNRYALYLPQLVLRTFKKYVLRVYLVSRINRLFQNSAKYLLKKPFQKRDWSKSI